MIAADIPSDTQKTGKYASLQHCDGLLRTTTLCIKYFLLIYLLTILQNSNWLGFTILSSLMNSHTFSVVYCYSTFQTRFCYTTNVALDRFGLWVCLHAATVHIHHRHLLLLLLNPKADNHIIALRKVQSWVIRGTALRVCCRCPGLLEIAPFDTAHTSSY